MAYKCTVTTDAGQEGNITSAGMGRKSHRGCSFRIAWKNFKRNAKKVKTLNAKF